MNIRRGDILLVYFPYSDLKRVKKRPALVVQADGLKTGRADVIVAQITTQLDRAEEPSRVRIYVHQRRYAATNLHQDCLIATDNLTTIGQDIIEKKIGKMIDMRDVDQALKITLGLEELPTQKPTPQ